MSYILETEQIHNAIARKLETAQRSIKICVAWFTCSALSTVIKDRLRKVKVSIIISDHEFNRKAGHFKTLVKFPNCTLWVLPTIDKKLMHNKFCVIDESVVLTGSYNWSDKAESNYENILICEDGVLAEQFGNYFDKLISKSDVVTDFAKYIRGFVSNAALEDYEDNANELAREFEDQIWANLQESKKYIRIKFATLSETIAKYSGVGAARLFCNDRNIQSGLNQLKQSGRFDLSFEWMVLQPKYSTLFSANTKATARTKLGTCGYNFPDYMQESA